MTDDGYSPRTSQGPAEPGRGAGRPDEGSPASAYAGAGLQFALSLLLFLFAGQWLDRRFGTGPWLMIVGMLIGGGAGFYSMYTKLMAANAREEQARRERKAREARDRELGQ